MIERTHLSTFKVGPNFAILYIYFLLTFLAIRQLMNQISHTFKLCIVNFYNLKLFPKMAIITFQKVQPDFLITSKPVKYT